MKAPLVTTSSPSFNPLNTTYESPNEGPSSISRNRNAGVSVSGCLTYTMERFPVHRIADFGITTSLLYCLRGDFIIALAYISGFSSIPGFVVSTRTFAVRVDESRIGFINDILPVNVFPGNDCRVYSTWSPIFKNGRSDSYASNIAHTFDKSAIANNTVPVLT